MQQTPRSSFSLWLQPQQLLAAAVFTGCTCLYKSRCTSAGQRGCRRLNHPSEWRILCRSSAQVLRLRVLCNILHLSLFPPFSRLWSQRGCFHTNLVLFSRSLVFLWGLFVPHKCLIVDSNYTKWQFNVVLLQSNEPIISRFCFFFFFFNHSSF